MHDEMAIAIHTTLSKASPVSAKSLANLGYALVQQLAELSGGTKKQRNKNTAISQGDLKNAVECNYGLLVSNEGTHPAKELAASAGIGVGRCRLSIERRVALLP